MADYLKKEDYEEPCCTLNMHPEVAKIPTSRVIEKLDEYLSRKDYDSARKHLDYWRNEAVIGRDQRGELTVLNEQIGLFRKTGEKEEGLKAIDNAIALCLALEMEGTVTYATTLLNAGTAYRAFEMSEKALSVYEEAKKYTRTRSTKKTSDSADFTTTWR